MCVRACIHVCVCCVVVVCVSVCVRVWVGGCARVHACECVCVRAPAYVCARVCVSVCVWGGCVRACVRVRARVFGTLHGTNETDTLLNLNFIYNVLNLTNRTGVRYLLIHCMLDVTNTNSCVHSLLVSLHTLSSDGLDNKI